jgi:hypothetical protein
LRIVNSDQQHVRRHVIGHELLPVLGREHGLIHEPAQVGPARANRSVEDRSDRRSVPGSAGRSVMCGMFLPALVHEIPPSALGISLAAVASTRLTGLGAFTTSPPGQASVPTAYRRAFTLRS